MGLINLRHLEPDRSIYRVFGIQRLLELFLQGRNTLVRPKLWDDPFENFVLESFGELESGERYRVGFKDALYGQCWSLVRDSDALWRIYSPDKQGVRVRTTGHALIESLMDSCDVTLRDVSCFIGEVDYLPQKTLLKLLSKPGSSEGGILDPSGKGQAATLLMKRREFSHEKEVRLIYFHHGDPLGDVYQYDVSPSDLFDEIAFDPRLSDELLEVYQGYFEGLGFPGKIIRSPLYRVPELKHRFRSSS